MNISQKILTTLCVLTLLSWAVSMATYLTTIQANAKLFYIKNKIEQADNLQAPGYVAIFRTVKKSNPTDTIIDISPTYRDYDFLKDITDMEYMRKVTDTTFIYVSYEMVDLECSECRNKIK